MDWGYIMDIAVATIIGALIAVAGTILVNWLGNRKGYKDIDRKIGQLDNTTLSGEHSKITNDIIHTIEDNSRDLNNTINKKVDVLDNRIGVLDNTTLSGQNNDIIKKVDNISQFLIKERDTKLQKNNLLSYDVQKINSSIENLSGFAEIMKNLSAENSELKAENYTIKNENKQLTQENADLKEQLSHYQNLQQSNNFTQSY